MFKKNQTKLEDLERLYTLKQLAIDTQLSRVETKNQLQWLDYRIAEVMRKSKGVPSNG